MILGQLLVKSSASTLTSSSLIIIIQSKKKNYLFITYNGNTKKDVRKEKQEKLLYQIRTCFFCKHKIE